MNPLLGKRIILPSAGAIGNRIRCDNTAYRPRKKKRERSRRGGDFARCCSLAPGRIGFTPTLSAKLSREPLPERPTQ